LEGVSLPLGESGAPKYLTRNRREEKRRNQKMLHAKEKGGSAVNNVGTRADQ